MRWIAPAAVALALLALPVLPVRAQCGLGPEPCRPDAPTWVGEFAALSANAVLGGLTAGLVSHVRGGEFGDAFLRGLGGGAGVYAGKRIASERFDGAGLLGRQVAAVGTSMVRNAGQGEAAFTRLLLPIGPVWLELGPRFRPAAARIEPFALGWTLYGLLEAELEFDAGRSLSAGTAVFRTRGTLLSFDGEEAHAAGMTNAGVILLADVPAYGNPFMERSFAHERAHVLQQDFLGMAWTDPLVQRLVRRTPATGAVGRRIAFNLSTELMRGLGRLFPEHENRPWEIEAIFFGR